MKILLLNYPYLKKEYIQLGHQVISIGSYLENDIFLEYLSFDSISKSVNLAEISIIIYSDSLDKHILVEDLHKFNQPLIYIAIDSTINYFWQKYFAQEFDLVFFDQIGEYIDYNKNYSKNSHPLLLGYDDSLFKDYGLKKEFDITFVGRVNEQTRIKRSNILNRIKKNGFNINIIIGEDKKVTPLELAKIYNQSKIVINENLFPAINLRLFEIMGSKSLCFTEDSNPYLNYYFQDGVELITYNSQNLISKLQKYIGDNFKRGKISLKGYGSVKKFHKDLNRADFVLKQVEHFKKENKKQNPNKNCSIAAMYISLKWKNDNSFVSNNCIINNYCSKQGILDILDLKLLYYQKKIDEITDVLISLFNKKVKPDIELFIFAYLFFKETNNLDQANLILKEIKASSFSDMFYLFGESLFQNKKNVMKWGFTAETNSPIFYSAFDFFYQSFLQGSEKEKSLLRLIEITDSGKAFDYSYIFTNNLLGLFPNNEKYQKMALKYQNLSYAN